MWTKCVFLTYHRHCLFCFLSTNFDAFVWTRSQKEVLANFCHLWFYNYLREITQYFLIWNFSNLQPLQPKSTPQTLPSSLCESNKSVVLMLVLRTPKTIHEMEFIVRKFATDFHHCSARVSLPFSFFFFFFFKLLPVRTLSSETLNESIRVLVTEIQYLFTQSSLYKSILYLCAYVYFTKSH
jgi:hypothetical protein